VEVERLGLRKSIMLRWNERGLPLGTLFMLLLEEWWKMMRMD